jgi:NADH:ubiquinone oxidoreductase subunit 3 (subunit A)
MSSNISTSIRGVLEVMLVVFIILKLTHLIAWSWWYVMMPLWLTSLIVMAGLIIALIIVGIYSITKGDDDEW